MRLAEMWWPPALQLQGRQHRLVKIGEGEGDGVNEYWSMKHGTYQLVGEVHPPGVDAANQDERRGYTVRPLNHHMEQCLPLSVPVTGTFLHVPYTYVQMPSFAGIHTPWAGQQSGSQSEAVPPVVSRCQYSRRCCLS
jgi:hypothetical protein